MIEAYREGLFEIYEQAPIFGFGRSESLVEQFSRYKNILREICSMQDFAPATYPLLLKSQEIEKIISQVADDNSDVSRHNFENALKLLSNDIFSLLEILKFTGEDSPRKNNSQYYS